MMSKHDMGPPSRASSMHPPPNPPSRVPLMTPSASPPVQRPFARQSSTPSATKKRRVSRAPSVSAPSLRGFSVTSASSSSISPAFNFDASADPSEELDSARRASSFRVLNVWSQLAEKYARRLDEDDIVDLRKETIVKDCGVLRSSGDMFEIGYFAEEREKAERLDNGIPLIPADDEPDELDAFADTPDNISRSETDVEEDDLGLAQRTKRLPPVRELDPADAADLAEFLRAEQVRKETFGDPDEEYGDQSEEGDEQGSEALEDEVDDSTAVSRSDTEQVETERERRSPGDEEEDAYEESIRDSEDVGRSSQNYSRLSTPSGSPEFDILDISNLEDKSDAEGPAAEEPLAVPSDEDSEDELGGWDCDEGSTLYSVRDFSEEVGHEKQDNPESPSRPTSSEPPSKPRRMKIRGKAKKSTPTKRTSTARQPSKSPSQKKISTPRSPSSPVIQLQTPPRSISFGPEPSNSKITTTYSRKRRGSSSSPRKTPLRIESTVSESSQSETEDPPARVKDRIQSQSLSSPTKKVKLVPEVYIDSPRSSKKASGKEPPVKEKHIDSPYYIQPATPRKSTKLKGKGKAVENFDDVFHSETETGPTLFSPSPEILDTPASSLSHSSKGYDNAEFPKRSSSLKKTRKRAYSPVANEPADETRTVDVVMASPTTPSSKRSSRRASSSRRTIASEVVHSYNDHESGPTSQVLSSHRSRSRPSVEQAPSSPSRSHHPPELNEFSFTPPQLRRPPVGYQSYTGLPLPPPLGHQQNPMHIPNLQDPNAQYHLAQALQSLSILMGGTLPFPPSPVNPSSFPHPLAPLGQHGHHPWLPYTPRHRNPSLNFDTPQSVATAPPTSSPLGSDYSDSIPSSPTKRPMQERGRSHSKSQASKIGRPKSAVRESATPSRSRSRSLRRVSFSSPEATQIEDNAFEYVSDNFVEVANNEGEDSVFERRRIRHEEQMNRTSQLRSPRRHIRAQTPGPPDRASGSAVNQSVSRHPSHRDRVPKTSTMKASHPDEAPSHTRRKGYR